jgi:hypothetical protein
VLTTIDFDDDAFLMAGEVDNVSAYPDLAAEVRTLHAQAVQVRPELLLGVGRHASHVARKYGLRGCACAVAHGPDAGLIAIDAARH